MQVVATQTRMCICWKKGVASKGKSKGTTRKGIARAIEGATWAAEGGAIKEVIKGVVKEDVKRVIEEGNCSIEKEVWDGSPRCCDSGDDKGEMTWTARKCDLR